MAQKSKHNPQGDDEVEAGYQKNQKEHKEKKEKKEKKDDSNYEVDRSGGTVRGPDKDET